MPQIKDITPTRTAATLLGTDLLPLQAAAGGAGSTAKVAVAELAKYERNSTVYQVTDYGLVEGDNVANGPGNLTALNALITTVVAAGKGVILFPAGVFYISGIPNPVTGTGAYPNGFWVLGMGESVTTIKLNPLADMPIDRALFQFGDLTVGAPNQQVNNCGISGVKLVAVEDVFRKTAIRFEGASHGCRATNIYLTSLTGWMLGKDSIGIDIAGHEQVSVSEVTLYASIPVRVDRCPVAYGTCTRGWLSSDHFNFNNCTYAAGPASCAPTANGGTLPHANVLFSDYTDMQQVSFTGRQVMVGGRYGLYARLDHAIRVDAGNPSSPQIYSSGLVIENLRTEQMYGGTEGCSVHLESNDGCAIRKLVLNNCELTDGSLAPVTRGGAPTGVYTKGVVDISINAPLIGTSSGRFLEVDATGIENTELLTCEISGAWANESGLANFVSLPDYMYRVRADGSGYGQTRDNLPTTVKWRRDSLISSGAGTVTPLQAWQGDACTDIRTLRIAAAGTQNLPLNRDWRGVTFARVKVSVRGIAPWSTVNGHAEYLLAPTDMTGATNGIRLLTSTGTNAGVSGTPAAGQFGITSDGVRLAANVVLRNAITETCDFLVEVIALQGVAPVETAIAFNGTSQAITGTGTGIYQAGAALTDSGEFVAFCKFRPSASQSRVLFGMHNAGTPSGVTLSQSGLDIVASLVPTSGSTQTHTASSVLTAGQWATAILSVSRSANRVQLAVNDSLVVDVAYSLGAYDMAFANVTNIEIAQNPAGTQFFSGAIAALACVSGASFDISKVCNRRIFHGPAGGGLQQTDIGFTGRGLHPTPLMVFGGNVQAQSPWQQGWSYNNSGWKSKNRGNSTEWTVIGGPLSEITS